MSKISILLGNLHPSDDEGSYRSDIREFDIPLFFFFGWNVFLFDHSRIFIE